MGADEGAGDGHDHENDEDLRNEGQRHFLDLGQGLASAIRVPTSIAAPTAGPEATMIVQIAAWTMSRASRSFMTG